MSEDFTPNVLTPRLLRVLRSGARPASTTKVRVLLTFNSSTELEAYLEKQNDIAILVGATDDERKPKVVNILKSALTVALEVRVDVLQALDSHASEIGLRSIDDDFSVDALLSEVIELEKVNIARTADLRGEGVRIAVLDTGIDERHPDLEGIVEGAFDMTGEGPGDSVGHGTHVACIVAGRGVVDATKAGIADRAMLIDVKVLGANGSGSASSVIAGIEAAVEHGADIINMSLGASGEFDGTDPLSLAANWAVSQGAVVCAAAGNCGPGGSPLQCAVRGDRTISSPGCAADIITVGALNKDLTSADYSSRGPTGAGLAKPDVVVIGSAIVAARAMGTSMGIPVDERYTRASGTSMASPVCAGLAALYLEQARKEGSSPTSVEVKERIRGAAKPLPGLGENIQGCGFLEAERLLNIDKSLQSRLEVVQFAPAKREEAEVGRHHHWILRLSNSKPQTLYDVTAAFDSVDDLSIEPPGKSFGTLEGGQVEHVFFTLRAETPKQFTVPVTLSYRTDPSGEMQQEQVMLSAVIRPKMTGVNSSRLEKVIEDAISRYLAFQNDDGTWIGSIMYNAWTPGMYAIMCRIIGLAEPQATLDWLEENRLGTNERGELDETWGFIDIKSLHMLESTLAAEIALEIWGRGRNEKTWDYLNEQTLGRLQPAMALADPFTQTFAALANPFRPKGSAPYYSLSDILAPPIEAILSPPLLKLSLPRFIATWAQDAVLGLMITLTVAKGDARYPTKKSLLKMAESKLLRNQNPDGSWYCTVLPSLSATMALHFLGYEPDDPIMSRSLAFLESLQRSDGYVERFHLPVWDSGLSVIALRAAGVPSDEPSLLKTGHYLIASQDPVSGAVPFQKENSPWPDTDDTSVVCLALDELNMGKYERRKNEVILDCLRWLLFIQGRDGGWASFQKNQSKKVQGRLPFFLNDPPTADVSGHVLSSLKLLGKHSLGEVGRPSVERGIEWMRRYQLGSGAWFGRWGLTYTYGTTAVLQALFDLGNRMDEPYVSRAVDSLVNMQREDGGWGEGYLTYYNLDASEEAPATVEQTAWSVLGLLTVPQTPRINSHFSF